MYIYFYSVPPDVVSTPPDGDTNGKDDGMSPYVVIYVRTLCPIAIVLMYKNHVENKNHKNLDQIYF